jgi:hypothetical protein
VADRRHITDLRIALEGERRAAAQVSAARRHADALLDKALVAGIPYAKLARVALKMRLGRAPTAQERQREIDRLRQRRRRAMTGGHVNVADPRLKTTLANVGLSGKEIPMTRLVKRITTTTEEFGVDDEKDDDLCADDTKAAAAGDEDDDEEEDEEQDEE